MKSRDSSVTSQSSMSSHLETRKRINPRGTFKHAQYRPSGRRLGDLFTLHFSNPVLATLTYVFPSKLISSKFRNDVAMASQFL